MKRQCEKAIASPCEEAIASACEKVITCVDPGGGGGQQSTQRGLTEVQCVYHDALWVILCPVPLNFM